MYKNWYLMQCTRKYDDSTVSLVCIAVQIFDCTKYILNVTWLRVPLFSLFNPWRGVSMGLAHKTNLFPLFKKSKAVIPMVGFIFNFSSHRYDNSIPRRCGMGVLDGTPDEKIGPRAEKRYFYRSLLLTLHVRGRYELS